MKYLIPDRRSKSVDTRPKRTVKHILTRRLKDGSIVPVEIKTTTIHRDGSRDTFYNLKNEGQHQRSASSLISFKSEDSLKIVGLQHVINDTRIVLNNLGQHRNIKVVMKRRDHSMQTTQSLQEKLAQLTQ